MLQSPISPTFWSIFVVLGGMVAADTWCGMRAIQAQQTQPKLELPMDIDSPILSLTYEGGFRRPQAAGFEPTPLVSLFADGRVVTGGSSPQQLVMECRLPEQFWQDLVAKLVDEDQFLTLDSQTIQADVEREAKHKIMDAPTSVIVLRLANRTHRVEVYGSTMMAAQAPQSASLQRFVAAEKRLRNLYAVALTGGLEEIQPILDQIKEKLTPQFPALSHLSANDLQWCSRQASGNLRLEFSANMEATAVKPVQKIKVTYVREGGKSSIEYQLQDPPPDKLP